MVPCNWLQIMENSMDPHHVEGLHGHHLAAAPGAQARAGPTHYRRRHEKLGFDAFRQGIVNRTRETLGRSDAGVALLRRILLEEMEKVRRGEDPLGVVRDPEENRAIALPQEENKYRDGAGFRWESMELGHVRFSPIKDEV